MTHLIKLNHIFLNHISLSLQKESLRISPSHGFEKLLTSKPNVAHCNVVSRLQDPATAALSGLRVLCRSHWEVVGELKMKMAWLAWYIRIYIPRSSEIPW